MQALINYFQAVLEDGDYMNDWLTHLPSYLQGFVEVNGQLLSYVVDFIKHFI